jgi:hypothetical protein
MAFLLFRVVLIARSEDRSGDFTEWPCAGLERGRPRQIGDLVPADERDDFDETQHDLVAGDSMVQSHGDADKRGHYGGKPNQLHRVPHARISGDGDMPSSGKSIVAQLGAN